MPTSVRTPWRLRAAALAGAGALATVAALAPSGSDPEPSAARGPAADSVETRDESAAPLAPTSTDTSATPASPPLSEQVLIAASLDAVETAPEPTEFDAEAEAEPAEAAPAPEPEPEPARSVWDQLADCESGEWTGDGGFVTASANWSSTAGLFEGGLQFHPDTWDGYRDPGMPGAAYEASRAQQIVVAERVLAEQGWKAWPVCSRKLGLR